MAMPNGRDAGRAERFEEEKRRIIDSCFNKKDVDGSGMIGLPLPSITYPQTRESFELRRCLPFVVQIPY